MEASRTTAEEKLAKEENLNIVVAIKQVPDSAARVVVENGHASWGDAPLILNPWDEYAVEAALVQAEATGAEVTAITIGSESAKDALKTTLAMGVNNAVLISDPALSNVDSQAIARILAAAIEKIGDVGLVFMGRQAIDYDSAVTATQTARVLGWPSLTQVAVIQETNANIVRVERVLDEGRQLIESKLPAVISVSKDIGEPRYPSFMGIRKAARANIPEWSLADLGISAPVSVTRWLEILNPPPRQVTTEIISGGSPEEIAEILVDKILAEKVL